MRREHHRLEHSHSVFLALAMCASAFVFSWIPLPPSSCQPQRWPATPFRLSRRDHARCVRRRSSNRESDYTDFSGRTPLDGARVEAPSSDYMDLSGRTPLNGARVDNPSSDYMDLSGRTPLDGARVDAPSSDSMDLSGRTPVNGAGLDEELQPRRPRTRRRLGGRASSKLARSRTSMTEELGARRSIAMAGLTGLGGFLFGVGFQDYSSEGEREMTSTRSIQQGCVLMSHPGRMFAKRQQYFHKSAILLIKHRDNFDTGIILNRPTAFSTKDFEVEGDPWRVFFGGDCEGLNDLEIRPVCLHTSAKYERFSQQIVDGVYTIPFEDARGLVSDGLAKADDFMLFCGYCGWGGGQLQRELDRGDWTMAPVSTQLLVDELREESMALQRLSQAAVDDGISLWRHMYARVDQGMRPNAMVDYEAGDDLLGDDMLRVWIRMNLEPKKRLEDASMRIREAVQNEISPA